MESIGAIGGAAGQIPPLQITGGRQAAAGGQIATAGSSVTASSQTVSMQSSMTQITQVHSQVDGFLNSLGVNLENNPLLRMIIGLLILELLLGKDGQAAPGNGGEFGALTQLNQLNESNRMMMIQSSASVFRADYYATELTGAQSVQSSAGSHPDHHPGGQLDLSA